jgi:cytochrome c-type biogenesis protein CcmH/NrfF
MRLALALCAGLLALMIAGCGGESDEPPTLAELEKKFICPTCQTTLELSNAPVADRMRQFISERIAAGDSEEEIEDALVAQFGEAVLASPPKEGFNLLAWVLPLAAGAVAVTVVALALRRWSRTRPEAAPATPEAEPLDPELERRVDEELARFD